MKTLSICAVILFSIFSFNHSNAQAVKKETIKVWGNCGMCKAKIEKAAKSAGATAANWNEDSKELKVTFPVNKTSGTKIQQAIANTGYDTQDFTADNKVYEKLHGCCQYERKSTASTTDHKMCADTTSCKHDEKGHGCKMDKSSGKEKSCCSKESATADHKKCSNEKGCNHDKKMESCKEKSCCSKPDIKD